MLHNKPVEFITSDDFEHRRKVLGIQSLTLRMAMWQVLGEGKGIRESARAMGIDPGQLSRSLKLYRESDSCPRCGETIK